jgi:hypothetical protein
MGIANSRKIMIDGRVFRWTVGRNRGDDFSQVYAHSPDGGGCVLRARVWSLSITPDIVRRVIVGALNSGWDPNTNGTFEMRETQQYLE